MRYVHALLLMTSMLMLNACTTAVPVLGGSDAEAPAISEVKLPAYAQAQKDELAELFEIVKQYDPEYRVQVNSREEKLLAITLAKDVGEIKEEQRFELPADIVGSWGFFQQVQLVGDTNNLKVDWENTNGASGAVSYWYKTNDRNVFQARGVPVQPQLGYTLVVSGEGRLDALRLQVANEGISAKFDESPWSVLGADKPILPVSIDVDVDSALSIAGITEFEDDKYFRVYAAPWGGPWGVHDYFLAHGFTPGRQIFKIAPALELGYDDEYPNKPAFTEDPNRPHHADPAFFESGWTWPETIPRGIANRYPTLDFVLCFDEWPSFNRHSGEGVVNSRGTPVDFVAAAETAGRTLRFIVEQTGITPKWIEVKNESDIPYEWSYHTAPGEDGWAKLADFHNEMAKGVKEFVPEVLIGGPTTAYPNFAAANWNLARNHLKFMDRTKGKLDFYSHHFYEGDRLLFEDYVRQGGNSYLLGRMTAYLDLVRAHQANTDNIAPLVISEYGSLSGGGEDHQVWKKLRNYSAYMVQYMQRPDEIDITVPFHIPFVWWEPEAKDGIFIFETIDENRDLSALTANRPGMASGISGSPMTGIRAGKGRWFLDLWEGYTGTLLPIVSDTPHVNVHATADGRTLWVAISNLKSQRLAVDIAGALGRRKVRSAEQRRLYLDSGVLKFEKVDVSYGLDAVSLAAEETSVVKITLTRPIEPEQTLTQNRYYGSETLMATGEPRSLKISAPELSDTASVESAVLRVALQKENGFANPLKVKFNDRTIEVDLSESQGIRNYDTVKEIEIPADAIRPENTVVLNQQEEGGVMASAVLLLTTRSE
ncbi:MAG: hypothetical protein AAGH99_04045 [Planctomycetota bacterium]